VAKVVSVSGKKAKPFGMKVPKWLSASAPKLQEILAPVFKQVFLATDKSFKNYLSKNDNSVDSGKVEAPGAKGTYTTGTLYNSLDYTFEVRRTRGQTKFYYRVGSDAEQFQYIDEGFETGEEGINLGQIEDWIKRQGVRIKPISRAKFGGTRSKRKVKSTKTNREKAFDATLAKIWSSTRNRSYRALNLRKKILQYYESASQRLGLPTEVHSVLWRANQYADDT